MSKTKPMEVAHRDFTDTIAQVINNSGLPAFVVAQTLKLILVEVQSVEESAYKQALEEYNKPEEEAQEGGKQDG